MRVLALLAALALLPQPAAAQAPSTAAPATPVSSLAEAYHQFLLAQRFESAKDVDGAVAAYERAMAVDPSSAAIPASLADLQMRANRLNDAVRNANRALQLDAENREAHRVLGLINASTAFKEAAGNRTNRQAPSETLDAAIAHLKAAVEGQPLVSDSEAGLRDTLARVYVMAERYDDAIPLLLELVRWDPMRTDQARLLVDSYAAAGRADEAVEWLNGVVEENPQLYGTLGDFLARNRRWREAAAAYEEALKVSPRAFELRLRYGSMLLNAGGADNAARARDVLRAAVALRETDEPALYLLAEAERLSGDLQASEAAARRLIAQNALNPRGYVSLAESLSARRRYQEIVDTLGPAAAKFRTTKDSMLSLGLILPRLAEAYQQLGEHDPAIAIYEELRALSPKDPEAINDLIQANLSAKRFQAAIDLARQSLVDRPDDVWLMRLQAEALRQGGKGDEALALLSGLMQRHPDDPQAHLALAFGYLSADRGSQAVKVLQEAQTRFPDETMITFELGAALERQKMYAAAEGAFRKVIEQEPAHAPALNYLGYMFADRGEKLDESVDLIKRALALDPDNGSYLDSLGWAYFKLGRLDLAEVNLKRAAEQLPTNSVVLDHYGDLLAKLERHQAAIEAWTQALAGDGDSINKDDLDRKIRSARQRLDRR